jgi:hypothetical protein
MPELETYSLGAVTFNADGRVTITWHDDTTNTIRRPTYKELRDAKFRIAEIQAAFRASMRAIRDDIPGDNLEERQAGVQASNTTLEQQAIDWWRTYVAPLADRPFPEDPDTWPAEMIMGEGILIRVTDCWQFLPSDRGRSTPARPTATTL